MKTLYDLPEGSGRRFLFGLFGKDHDEPNCEKDGCGDCAIIVHYEHDMRALKLQIQSFERRLSEAVNSRCSCGGAGPGEGCDWCNLYHHVKGTVKREGVPTKCPRCGIMPAHHSGMCDECYEKMVREGGT